MRRILRLVYGVYASATFIVVVLLLFCPLLIVAPTLRLRRAIGRACVRSWLLVSFVRFRVGGLAHLPVGACVVVCNHSSYLDGIILTAALPGRFTFFVQHGAASWFYIGLILRRMGVHFVDRGTTRAAAKATRELIERVAGGEPFAIFPEGTFRAAPELMPFHSGAFLIAARAGVPIVPAVLRGTRRMLGEKQFLLRHSRIQVEVFAPIAPEGRDHPAIERLSAAVRAVMLAHCGERDGALSTAQPS